MSGDSLSGARMGNLLNHKLTRTAAPMPLSLEKCRDDNNHNDLGRRSLQHDGKRDVPWQARPPVSTVQCLSWC